MTILVIGNAKAGKTVVARFLEEFIGLKYVHLNSFKEPPPIGEGVVVDFNNMESFQAWRENTESRVIRVQCSRPAFLRRSNSKGSLESYSRTLFAARSIKNVDLSIGTSRRSVKSTCMVVHDWYLNDNYDHNLERPAPYG